jgi:septum formation protein
MIRALSGSYQQVHSGLALYLVEGSDSSLVFEGVDSTKVHFQTLTEADVSAYVDTGEGVDKAGGYGIQVIAGQLVDSIEGSFSSVVGLPVHVLSREIASLVHNGKL